MKKRILAVLLAVLLAAGLMPGTAGAESPVYYLDAAGEIAVCTDYTVITDTMHNLGTGWYVVSSFINPADRIECTGHVRLILTDTANLYAMQGIEVSAEGASLTVYAGSTNRYISGNGILQVRGQKNCAGIGGGDGKAGHDITVNGGMITAESDCGAGIGGGCHADGRNITVNGGSVTVTGDHTGAGIGGGNGGNGENITVNGGTVHVIPGLYAAGIGGGQNGSGINITVNGGTVRTEGVVWAAGIGGGRDGSGMNITVNGGTVIAEDVDCGPGIGGCSLDGKTTVTVNGGRISASSREFGAGIGTNGYCAEFSVILNGGNIVATGAEGFDGIGGLAEEAYAVTVSDSAVLTTKHGKKAAELLTVAPEDRAAAFGTGTARYFTMEAPDFMPDFGKTVTYLDADGGTHICTDCRKLTGKYTVLPTGTYAVEGALLVRDRLVCDGTVTLILLDGCDLNALSGIEVSGDADRQLTVFAGSTGDTVLGTGRLRATGNCGAAGIGGSELCDGGRITVNSGIVTAVGSGAAAGIGSGGLGVQAHDITVNGGTVTAVGSTANSGSEDYCGAGIGGGYGDTVLRVTVNGGTVTALGGAGAAGIGAGNRAAAEVRLNGGRVTAIGGSTGAGVGSGHKGKPSDVTVTEDDSYVTSHGETAANVTVAPADRKAVFGNGTKRYFAMGAGDEPDPPLYPPKTGDGGQPLLWAALFLSAALTGIAAYRRRPARKR